MSLRTEIIALVVRTLADRTSLVRKPEPFEELINELFTGESYDRRVARNVEHKADEVAALIKDARDRRKAKKNHRC